MSNEQEFSLESARAAAAADDLDRWVAEFLRSPGSDNAALAERLCSRTRWWLGPIRIPLGELHRLIGPPDEPALVPPTPDDLETVEEMEESLEQGWEPPPLIVSHRSGQLVVEDGNHRVEGMRRAGERDGWCIVCFDDPDERAAFRPPLAEAG